MNIITKKNYESTEMKKDAKEQQKKNHSKTKKFTNRNESISNCVSEKQANSVRPFSLFFSCACRPVPSLNLYRN